MRRFSFAILLLVISQSSAQQPAETKKVSDHDLLQGIWVITGLETGGKGEPMGPYRGSFVFSKDKAILREGTYPSIEYTFSLDATKTPNKSIDLTIKDKHIYGIYKFEKDELTLCLSMGGARPTEFATKAGIFDCERMTMRRKYTDNNNGFAVDIPGKPEEKQRKITTSAGQVTCSSLIFRNDTERLAYQVSVVAIGTKPDKKELEETMNALKKAMLTEMGITPNPMADPAKLITSGPLTFSEWTIPPDTKGLKDKESARIRVYAAGDNLVGLMVVGTFDERSRIADRFWNSFELIPAKP